MEQTRKARISRFAREVRRVVAGIPRGRVACYGAVARRAGFPGAARAVGSLMRGNVDPRIPCHRVVRSTGHVGSYNRGGSVAKIRKLREEGVLIVRGRVAKPCFLPEKW